MKIYNTLSKKVEEFIPNDKNNIKVYTCGPTVYDYAHIGNLRTYIFEDILVKSLRFIGLNVTRVMNITDVGHLSSDGDTGEDKMAKGALKTGMSVTQTAKFYTDCFLNDLKNLKLDTPDIVSPASEHISDYIEMIQTLLEKGYAYESNGNIYYDITKFDNYYELSGRNKDDQLVGVRDSVEEDKAKRNPGDFALWFTVSKFQNQELKWDSPWGVGYPGWHIECSGIAKKFLGDKIDIHCGAVDNIFPHHTNEIAQSDAYFGHKWCNYWVHGEFLNDESGKMSKSKGEFLTLNLLTEKGYNPLAYKFMCLLSHYRKPLVFTYDALNNVSETYKKLKNRINDLSDDGEINNEVLNSYIDKFKAELENNLNTANAITLIYDVLKNKEINSNTKREIIKNFDKVLSLDLIASVKREDHDEIMLMIEKRNEARKNKNYELADQIRNELLEKGIMIVDTREQTTYKEI